MEYMKMSQFDAEFKFKDDFLNNFWIWNLDEI